MKGALIGLGNVALNGHLPAWKKNSQFQIIAGIDSDSLRRELYLKLDPDSASFSTIEECSSLKLDFVDICTPPYTHFSLAQKALENGFHVVCEKPLVLSQKDLIQLEQIVSKNSKLLFTVHNWKYAPICRKIAEIIKSGVIGELQHCAWYVLRNGPSITTDKNNWRLDPQKSGGGILIDHGWHAFYLVLEWIGKKPENIHATLENRQYEDLPVEDTAKIKIEFENAAGNPLTSEIFLTWASRVRRNWGVVEGNKGSIQIEDDLLKVSIKKGSKLNESSEIYKFDQPLSKGSHHPEWFESVIEEFYGELTDESKRGQNFQMAKSCLRIIECSKESQLRNSTINF